MAYKYIQIIILMSNFPVRVRPLPRFSLNSEQLKSKRRSVPGVIFKNTAVHFLTPKPVETFKEPTKKESFDDIIKEAVKVTRETKRIQSEEMKISRVDMMFMQNEKKRNAHLNPTNKYNRMSQYKIQKIGFSSADVSAEIGKEEAMISSRSEGDFFDDIFEEKENFEATHRKDMINAEDQILDDDEVKGLIWEEMTKKVQIQEKSPIKVDAFHKITPKMDYEEWQLSHTNVSHDSVAKIVKKTSSVKAGKSAFQKAVQANKEAHDRATSALLHSQSAEQFFNYQKENHEIGDSF